MNFREEEFHLLLERIKRENLLIVVEGKKDKEALQKLGLSKIIILNKPLFQLVEEIKEKEIILLTDLDKTGRKLYHLLKKDLNKNGIKVNNSLRNFLIKTKKVNQIETISSGNFLGI